MKQSIVQLVKSALGVLEGMVGKATKKGELTVLCMHSTPSFLMPRFHELVKSWKKNYTFLHPNELEAFMRHPENYQQGPYLLLSFDDGLLNNYASAKLLAEEKISALYFAVPLFISAMDQDHYYRTRIRDFVDSSIDFETEDTRAMSWEQLKEIVAMGHVVGCHSMSHQLMSGMSEEQLEEELIFSKQVIEQMLQVKVEHFASPNNSLLSTDKSSCAMIERAYTFHHTTIPGTNTEKGKPRVVVYRRNVEVHWSKGAIAYGMGHWDLKRWKNRQIEMCHLHTSNR